MIKKMVLFSLMAISCCLLAETEYVLIPQIGSDAPAFKAATNLGVIDFPKNFKGKWVVLFSMPAAFTPICTGELAALMREKKEFLQMNCEVIGLTFNSSFDHNKWLRQTRKQAGVNKKIMLISDQKKKIAKLYGMYQPFTSEKKPMRSVFFIDPDSKIRSVAIYPMFNGRSMKEIKRLLKALQISDKNNEVTPVDWQEYDQTYDCPQCKK